MVSVWDSGIDIIRFTLFHKSFHREGNFRACDFIKEINCIKTETD